MSTRSIMTLGDLTSYQVKMQANDLINAATLQNEVDTVAAANAAQAEANQSDLDDYYGAQIAAATDPGQLALIQTAYAADQANLDAYNASIAPLYQADRTRSDALMQTAQREAAEWEAENAAEALAAAQAAAARADVPVSPMVWAQQVSPGDFAAVAASQAANDAIDAVLTSPISSGIPGAPDYPFTADVPQRNQDFQAPTPSPSITMGVSTPMLLAAGALLLGVVMFAGKRR